ncbi:MAG TPA: universal stress protein [Nitrososphaeraceae archaeon]|nr:universal stress protein [Nitrososphaeraceae archaeon]
MVSNQMEKKLSNILVPLDGSPTSMEAADYAIMLSALHHTQIVLLHVLNVAEFYSSLQFFEVKQPIESKEIIEEAKKEANKWFNSVKKKMDEKLGTQTKIETYIIISQSTVKSILDFAEEKNVDLIVVGTRGRSGIKKLLLGSTASGIVTYSSCPVIVVK